MKNQLRPAIKRILVKPFETPKETESGIILPQTLADPEGPRQGKIIAVGRDCQSELSLGDTVVYAKISAVELSHENERYAVVPDDAIIAIIK